LTPKPTHRTNAKNVLTAVKDFGAKMLASLEMKVSSFGALNFNYSGLA